ncbi:MAG: hypothetical protein M3P82_03685, partial [Bacteroidota bacterium]|nr:hypothetical protein [Bacteroidota bacterium]
MTETLKQIKSKIISSGKFRQLKNSFDKDQNKIVLGGVNGSLASFIVDYIYSNVNKKLFYISYDNDRIAKLKDDLDQLSEYQFLSAYSSKLSESESTSKILIDLAEGDEFIVIANASELSKKIISRDKFLASIIELKKGDEKSFDEVLNSFEKYHFNKKDFVDEEGDYSVRGGIIDLFAGNLESPVRIEFFGDSIESIREFDINSQRSVREIDSVKIGMNLSEDEEEKNYESVEDILDYIPEDAIVLIDEPEISLKEIKDDELVERLKKFSQILIAPFAKSISDYQITGEDITEINFDSKPQPDFHSNLKALYQNLCEHAGKGHEAFILASDEHQSVRIRELIEDFEDESIIEKDEQIHPEPGHAEEETKIVSSFSIKNRFSVIPESIHNGFILNDEKIILYTEHQIFGRYFKQIKKRKQKFKGLTFGELKELQYGDYVVHRDFGIGKYSGLKKITVGNNNQEVVVLAYQGSDTLFLNLNNINLIKKYSGAEGHVPVLTRLGGGEWDKLKARTKKQVKDIARDLIILYAKRKTETGFKFSADT